MTTNIRVLAARADAQRRFVVDHGVPAPVVTVRHRALGAAASEVILRLAPLPRFSRSSAQMIVIAAGIRLGIVEADGTGGFRAVDQYQLGSASR